MSDAGDVAHYMRFARVQCVRPDNLPALCDVASRDDVQRPTWGRVR